MHDSILCSHTQCSTLGEPCPGTLLFFLPCPLAPVLSWWAGGVVGVCASPGWPQGGRVHGDGVAWRSQCSPEACGECSRLVSVAGPALAYSRIPIRAILLSLAGLGLVELDLGVSQPLSASPGLCRLPAGIRAHVFISLYVESMWPFRDQGCLAPG